MNSKDKIQNYPRNKVNRKLAFNQDSAIVTLYFNKDVRAQSILPNIIREMS